VLESSLSDLQYLADRTAADYILQVQRMKAARKRTEMYESLGLHMCLYEGLYEGCENPVVGKSIFAHCEIHLEDFEKRWLEEDVETHGFAGREKHPLDSAFQGLEKGSMEDAIRKKRESLDAAYRIVEEFWNKQKERRRYLPKDLLARLESHEASLIDADVD
jgi:hypothetical protein